MCLDAPSNTRVHAAQECITFLPTLLQFADAKHWLQYFPPLAVRDIKAMGCGVDWRRRYGFIPRGGDGGHLGIASADFAKAPGRTWSVCL